MQEGHLSQKRNAVWNRGAAKFRNAAHERRYQTTLQALREECPTAMGFPVTVRRTSRVGPCFAWCNTTRDGKGFRIVLRTHIRDRDGTVREVTFHETRDSLVHEWAHAMAWTPEHPSLTDHSPVWGVKFAEAYRAVIED